MRTTKNDENQCCDSPQLWDFVQRVFTSWWYSLSFCEMYSNIICLLATSKVLHFVVDRWHIKWYRLREGKSASNNKNIVFFCESWIFLWLTIIPEIVTQSVDVAPITALQTTPVTSDTPILKPISGPRLGRLSVSVRVRGLGYWVVNRRERVLLRAWLSVRRIQF